MKSSVPSRSNSDSECKRTRSICPREGANDILNRALDGRRWPTGKVLHVGNPLIGGATWINCLERECAITEEVLVKMSWSQTPLGISSIRRKVDGTSATTATF